MTEIIDITRLLNARLAEWPGDAPFALRRTCQLADGATVNLSEVSMSVHAGTHIDAPWHFDDSGSTVDSLDLKTYIGPAVVIDVSGIDTITPGSLAALGGEIPARVLLRTGSWSDSSRFPDQVPVLAPETVNLLAEKGVRLVGVDLPSIDRLDSQELPIHHLLHHHGIAILEGLDLSAVVPGRYELIALPLKLGGADGSPVRAILRSRGDNATAG
jgi:arylformamidase